VELLESKLKTAVMNLDDLMLDSPHADRYLVLLMVGSVLPLNSALKMVDAKEIPRAQVKFIVEYLRLMKSSDLANLKKNAEGNNLDLKKLVGKNSDEMTIYEFLQRYDLFEVSPAHKIVKYLRDGFGKKSSDNMISWLESNVPQKKVRDSSEFARLLSTCFAKYFARETILPEGATEALEFNPEIEAKERDIMKRYASFINLYTSEFKSTQCQVAPLKAASSFARQHRYPKDWLTRFFKYYLEYKIGKKEQITCWRAEERSAQRFDALVDVEKLINSL